jgi:hypothetical protein
MSVDYERDRRKGTSNRKAIEALISELGYKMDAGVAKETITPLHPTHQQTLMRLMLTLAEALAENKYTDMRNERAVKLAKEIVERIEDRYLPYV